MQCAAGAVECEVVATFADSCAAVASDIARVDVSTGQLVAVRVMNGTTSIRKLRKEVMAHCGDDCRIVHKGRALSAG